MTITITNVTDRDNIVVVFTYKTWYTIKGARKIWKSVHNEGYQLASDIIREGTVDNISNSHMVTMFSSDINSADELKAIIDSQDGNDTIFDNW